MPELVRGVAEIATRAQAGELIVDSRAIPLTDVAPGTYTLVAGLYTWPGLVRLRLAGRPGDDARTISTVAVQ